MEKLLESLLANPEILSEFNEEIEDLNRKNNELLQRIISRLKIDKLSKENHKDTTEYTYVLNEENVTLVDKNDNGPLVLTRGSITDVAKQVASLLRSSNHDMRERGLHIHKMIMERDLHKAEE